MGNAAGRYDEIDFLDEEDEAGDAMAPARNRHERDAQHASTAAQDTSIHRELEELHDRAFKLQIDCQEKQRQAMANYKQAHDRLQQIDKLLAKPRYREEIQKMRRTKGMLPSPELRTLFERYRTHESEFKHANRQLILLTNRQHTYMKLIQNVNDYINNSTDGTLLHEYAESVRRVCELQGSSSVNPIESLLEATDRIQQNTLDAGVTAETLRDEVSRLNSAHMEEDADVVQLESTAFTRFMKHANSIQERTDIGVESETMQHTRGFESARREDGRSSREAADHSVDDDTLDEWDEQDDIAAHIPPSLIASLPAVPYRTLQETCESEVLDALESPERMTT